MAGLVIAPANGQQNTTQNPQTAPKQPVGATTQSGNVQPGTADSLLTSQQGVGLQNQALTTVSLANTGTQNSTSSAGQNAQPTKHHVNPALISIPIILCVVAVVLFWWITRSAKSTTD